jgi:NADPH:quinone reductase-like Zn-dependent oxidoreductase
MKALQIVQYGDFKDSLAIKEVSKPIIQAADVLIEVRATSINPIDKILVLGYLKEMLPIPFPSVAGYDVSGVVVEKGAEVTDFEIGDLVYSRVPGDQMGTIAEFVSVNNEAVSKKPENISFEEAAGIPLVGLTALQSLESVGIKENDKVLIHAGSGGVGSFAIQYAKSKGAYVYTTTSTNNVAWVKALGADRVIDYKTEEYKTIIKDADIVFDTLGDRYTIDAFQVIKEGGRVVSIIGALDEETAKNFGMVDYKLPEELAKGIADKNATYTYIFMNPNGTQLSDIKNLIEDEKIQPIIDKVYPFSESIEAYKHLDSGRAKGKIIIKIK